MAGQGPEPSRLAREASFWADWFSADESAPPGWEDEDPAGRCVLAHADMQAALTEVIPFYLGRETPAGLWEFGRDPAAIEALVPRFAGIVTRLAAANTIELRTADSAEDSFRDATRLSSAQLANLIHDPDVWTGNPDHDQRWLVLIGLGPRLTAGPGVVVDISRGEIYRDHER